MAATTQDDNLFSNGDYLFEIKERYLQVSTEKEIFQDEKIN